MGHHIKFCMKHIHVYGKSYMVFHFTLWHLALGGIERSNQGYLVFIGVCIIYNILLDSGAVRPRGLLFVLSYNYCAGVLGSDVLGYIFRLHVNLP